jgi:hypothetical protein
LPTFLATGTALPAFLPPARTTLPALFVALAIGHHRLLSLRAVASGGQVLLRRRLDESHAHLA